MELAALIERCLDKTKFNSIEDYADYCEKYLSFVFERLQAVIVSKNENHYRFFQYKNDGQYNITRPINSNLFVSIGDFDSAKKNFLYALNHIKDIEDNKEIRGVINKFVYTCQQSIGATLDALSAGRSNFARKINGDLFERYIRLLISKIGVSVRAGSVSFPVIVDNEALFNMTYQHDLIIEKDNKVKAVGSVKTSSKDRIDKIFIDKFLHNKIADTQTPHFAVFLNDVQRKGKENNYGINATFLAGRFKGYTVKLNPLNGVYYCDIRPNMLTDTLLKDSIRSFDCLLVEDIWNFA
jgi:hypothetical protein